jgi:4-hydroxybenzoate polyprenyltransferase
MLKNNIKKIISSIENSKTPLVYFIMTFIFIMILRDFLESFSTKNYTALIQIDRIISYNSFYISLAISLVILLFIITKERIDKIIKIILTGFSIIILPPIVDLIISKGNGYLITFLIPNTHTDLITRFFSFFGKMEHCSWSANMLCGVTPGIKVEIILVLLMSFSYFIAKNFNFLKSAFFSLLVYTTIFTYFSTIFIIEKLSGLTGLIYKNQESITTNFYFILIFLNILILFYILKKDYFKALIRDIRPFRLIHYELMLILGIALAINNNEYQFLLEMKNISNILIIMISILFAWLYSVVTNNIEDYEIDKISNKNRPLTNSTIKLGDYKIIAWAFLFTTLLYAGLVNFKAFFIILLFVGNYFIYSMPPLRLKRIPLLSKIFISINSLILILLGFLMVQYNIKNIPIIIYPIFLIGFTLTINFIDIKDYRGDKKLGIKTLPVLMGPKKSKLLIGLFFFLGYVFIFYITQLILFIILAFLQFYLINKKSYKEKYIFIVYLLSLVVFILSL